MADIFISYKRENKKQAAMLAEKLQATGFSVWWDHDLLGGDDFDVVISKEIAAAKAVIVIWSAESIHSRYVKDEASNALKRNILVPVTFDATEPPIGFGMTHTLIFENKERINEQELNKLHNSIRKKTGNPDYLIKEDGPNEKDVTRSLASDTLIEKASDGDRKKNKILPIVFGAAVLLIIIFFVVKGSGNKNHFAGQNMSTETAAQAVEVPSEQVEAITRHTPTEAEDVASVFSNKPLEASLPGDTITHYTIKEITDKSMTLTIEYSYNTRHNNGVYLGAWLFRSAESGGYPPVMLSSPTGSADITVSLSDIKSSFTSEGILVFMGEPYKSPFTYRVFHYPHTWKAQ